MLIKYALEVSFFQAAIWAVGSLGQLLGALAILGTAASGAEITLRGDSAKRAGGIAKAHEYRAHPPFH